MLDYFLLFASTGLFFAGIFSARKMVPDPLKIPVLSVLVLLFLLINILYFVSMYFTGIGFDESVLYHLYYGVSGAGLSEYLGVIVGSLVFMVAGFAVSYLIITGGKSERGSSVSGWFNLAPYLLLMAAILFNPSNKYFINTFLTAQKTDFYQYYRTPHIASRPDTIRNLVVIYAEGLERTYFDESIFPGLIKHLRALEARSTYFTNLKQVWGSSWTIGGMTATQCGIPLATVSHGNSMGGMDTFLQGAVCLGDLLHNEGFNLSYFGGAKLEFSGKGKFYNTHGFDNVRGRGSLTSELLDPGYMWPWGLFDDSLFDLAYKEFEKSSKRDIPFGLFMLTLDTHPPRGNRSASCNNIIYRDGSNSMLNAVACSDYLIGNFVNRILSSDYAKDTIIVVLSDHLSKKSSAYKLLANADRSNMLMIIDPENMASKAISRDGSPLDVGPTVLHALGYRASIGLGRDLLAGDTSLSESIVDVDKTLMGWKEFLIGFWEFPRIDGDVIIDEYIREVKINGRDFKIPSLITFNERLETRIRYQLDNSKKHKTLKDHVQNLDMATAFIWIDNCNTVNLVEKQHGLCVVTGKMGSTLLKGYQVNGEVLLPLKMIRKLAVMKSNKKTLIRNKARLN